MIDQNTNPDNVTRANSTRHVDPDQATLGNMTTTQNLESTTANSSTAAPPIPGPADDPSDQPSQIQSWDDNNPNYYNTSYNDYWQHYGCGQYPPFSYGYPYYNAGSGYYQGQQPQYQPQGYSSQQSYPQQRYENYGMQQPQYPSV